MLLLCQFLRPPAQVRVRTGRKNPDLFSITADKLHNPGDFPGTYGALKVSQLASDPDFNPAVNQRVRCAEEPWVNASGTTWPVA